MASSTSHCSIGPASVLPLVLLLLVLIVSGSVFKLLCSLPVFQQILDDFLPSVPGGHFTASCMVFCFECYNVSYGSCRVIADIPFNLVRTPSAKILTHQQC
ncbi:hypothetical protein Tco_0962432 [Tanacetum coccineum]